MALRAVISDIHGNLEALRAVLADIETQRADEIVCLGDIVGYGPNPVECVNIIRKVCRWSLCGNHDAALFMTHALGFNESAAKAIAWQRRKMNPGLMASPGKLARWLWLENLPSLRREGKDVFVHASPRDPLMEYVLEEDFKDNGFGASEKASEMFDCFECVCFVGHSHRPGVATHDFKWIKPTELQDGSYVIPEGKKTLINIGAVGQPRDKNKDSCYVLYDGSSVRYRRVAYDVQTTMKKMASIPDLDKRLAERLAHGS